MANLRIFLQVTNVARCNVFYIFSPMANTLDLDPEWGPVSLTEEVEAAIEVEARGSTGDGMLAD